MNRDDLVSRLLDLSNELLIKGDPDSAWTCTQAAARILAIPHMTTNVQYQEAWKTVLADLIDLRNEDQS